MLDLADANLAHYRNSADYQDATFFTGQPQIWVAGADAQWMEEMKKAGIYFGSRAIGVAPVGGSVTLIQAQPNMAARESMKDIKEDMISQGARLITPGGAAKTAEQSGSETAANHSVLSLVSQNVSTAYSDSLAWAALFMNETGDTGFIINTDFVGLMFDPSRVDTVVKTWLSGGLPDSDYFENMRGFGLIAHDKTDQTIEGELEASSNAAPTIDLDSDPDDIDTE